MDRDRDAVESGVFRGHCFGVAEKRLGLMDHRPARDGTTFPGTEGTIERSGRMNSGQVLIKEGFRGG